MSRLICRLTAALVPAVLLAACEAPPPADEESVARPVKTLVVSSTGAVSLRRFPARIDAGRKAQLAFRVPGTLKQLPVNEGDRVTEGGLVAGLDPTDYQLVVNERTTTFENARKNYERGKELVGKGAISQMDFDRLEAEFRNARTGLEAARQDLSYTRLTAPFDGTIARRHVENFEEVQAKQVVMDLQDTTRLVVQFDVPERLIRSLTGAGCRGESVRERATARVTFDELPGRSYPLTFREVATRADDATQTFEVSYTMERDESVAILPGMSADVSLDLSACTDGEDAAIRIPVAALSGDTRLRSRVWIVDEATMTVTARTVEVGGLQGDTIEVLAGLEPGERIVVAGAAFLAEGMAVTLLPRTEQAAARPGE